MNEDSSVELVFFRGQRQQSSTTVAIILTIVFIGHPLICRKLLSTENKLEIFNPVIENLICKFCRFLRDSTAIYLDILRIMDLTDFLLDFTGI